MEQENFDYDVARFLERPIQTRLLQNSHFYHSNMRCLPRLLGTPPFHESGSSEKVNCCTQEKAWEQIQQGGRKSATTTKFIQKESMCRFQELTNLRSFWWPCGEPRGSGHPLKPSSMEGRRPQPLSNSTCLGRYNDCHERLRRIDIGRSTETDVRKSMVSLWIIRKFMRCSYKVWRLNVHISDFCVKVPRNCFNFGGSVIERH